MDKEGGVSEQRKKSAWDKKVKFLSIRQRGA